MPEIETSIWLALRARVASLTLNPALAISWPKEAFTPPQSPAPALLPYLVVQHLPNVNSRLFIGGMATHRRQGILQITLKYPLALSNQQPGNAETVQAEIVGHVAAHFPADLPMSYGDIVLKVERPPDIGAAFRDGTDPYWQTPVSVRYYGFI